MTDLTLPGIPATIQRGDVVALVAALGIDVAQLRSLTIDRNAVVAEVYATNERGHRYAIGNEPAMHRVIIHIVEDEAPPR